MESDPSQQQVLSGQALADASTIIEEMLASWNAGNQHDALKSARHLVRELSKDELEGRTVPELIEIHTSRLNTRASEKSCRDVLLRLRDEANSINRVEDIDAVEACFRAHFAQFPDAQGPKTILVQFLGNSGLFQRAASVVRSIVDITPQWFADRYFIVRSHFSATPAAKDEFDASLREQLSLKRQLELFQASPAGFGRNDVAIWFLDQILSDAQEPDDALLKQAINLAVTQSYDNRRFLDWARRLANSGQVLKLETLMKSEQFDETQAAEGMYVSLTLAYQKNGQLELAAPIFDRFLDSARFNTPPSRQRAIDAYVAAGRYDNATVIVDQWLRDAGAGDVSQPNFFDATVLKLTPTPQNLHHAINLWIEERRIAPDRIPPLTSKILSTSCDVVFGSDLDGRIAWWSQLKMPNDREALLAFTKQLVSSTERLGSAQQCVALLTRIGSLENHQITALTSVITKSPECPRYISELWEAPLRLKTNESVQTTAHLKEVTNWVDNVAEGSQDLKQKVDSIRCLAEGLYGCDPSWVSKKHTPQSIELVRQVTHFLNDTHSNHFNDLSPLALKILYKFYKQLKSIEVFQPDVTGATAKQSAATNNSLKHKNKDEAVTNIVQNVPSDVLAEFVRAYLATPTATTKNAEAQNVTKQSIHGLCNRLKGQVGPSNPNKLQGTKSEEAKKALVQLVEGYAESPMTTPANITKMLTDSWPDEAKPTLQTIESLLVSTDLGTRGDRFEEFQQYANPPSAGIWATLIIAGITKVQPIKSKHLGEVIGRIGAAVAEGEDKLLKALSALGEESNELCESDRHFSRKELMRIVNRYPSGRHGAYAPLPSTARSRIMSAQTPKEYLSGFLTSVSEAHARLGYPEGVDRMREAWTMQHPGFAVPTSMIVDTIEALCGDYRNDQVELNKALLNDLDSPLSGDFARLMGALFNGWVPNEVALTWFNELLNKTALTGERFSQVVARQIQTVTTRDEALGEEIRKIAKTHRLDIPTDVGDTTDTVFGLDALTGQQFQAFKGLVAHDLGTPRSSLSGLPGLVKEISRTAENIVVSVDDDAQIAKAANQIAEQAQTILQRLDRILPRLTRLHNLLNTPVDNVYGDATTEVTQLVHMVMEAFATEAIRNKIVIEQAPSSWQWVRSNGTTLAFALENLISNSMKELIDIHAMDSDFRGKIMIRVEHLPPPVEEARDVPFGWVVINVRDNGRGIREDLTEDLHTANFTSDPGQGLGIGLRSTADAVFMAGGQLLVPPKRSSQEGASFTIRLPAGQRSTLRKETA